jgi:ribosomal protein L37E
VTTAVAPASTLTATDRCDRCGAQAYLKVELSCGFELLFCALHAREHEDKLREVAVNVVDETAKLSS